MSRLLITGSRNWNSPGLIESALKWALDMGLPGVLHPHEVTVVHGACRGADIIAQAKAEWMGFNIEPHPAKWRVDGVYNRAAGFERNKLMVDLGADLCLAFIKNQSRGATMCADLAEKAGIPVRRYLR